MSDVLIVGGGTAGLTAALYARRAGKTATVLECSTFGGQIASSPKVENYPGIPSVSGAAFSEALLDQVLDAGAETEFERATSFRAAGEGFEVTAGKSTFSGRSLVLAIGTRHRRLGVKGEAEFSGKGVSFCAVCDGAFYRGKTVAVIGGGSSALSSALYLSALAEKVILIHRRDAFRGEQALQSAVFGKQNVELLLSRNVAEFRGGKGLESLVTDRGEEIAVSAAFVSVGQVPDSEALRGFVALDESGYIVAGEDTATSVPGVFAAGDCRTKSVRQLATAAGDGAVAALAACAYADGARA